LRNGKGGGRKQQKAKLCHDNPKSRKTLNHKALAEAATINGQSLGRIVAAAKPRAAFISAMQPSPFSMHSGVSRLV
jgi:hypothetical protein